MDIQRQFPSVHWIWGGGISFVYEVHPRVVVKDPKSGEFEREQFQKELEIYQVFSQHPPCPSIVQCFLFSSSGIFLEYMRDISLSSRIQKNHTRDQQTMVVTSVEKLEPLPLRKEWMNDLAQAVAFLESVNLAHGDLRPENVLLDRNRLKLSDFDCTAKIGTNYEACMAPFMEIAVLPRILTIMVPKVVDLLQNMEFPKLDGNPLIDNIIDKCWHNKYVTVSELAAHTKTLLNERTDAMENNENGKKKSSEVATLVKTPFNERWRMVMGRIIHGICYRLGVWWRSLLQSVYGEATIARRASGDNRDVDQNCMEEDFFSKKESCQDLEKRGLLHALSSGEPEQIGFSFDWYRHSLQG
ncbi:hypothetical protein N7465_009622 [Penicillium sp. CMV-2018d]|nr:hypothetical protein N7465_009622 [Penicillium sp. CMV-2018d]